MTETIDETGNSARRSECCDLIHFAYIVVASNVSDRYGRDLPNLTTMPRPPRDKMPYVMIGLAAMAFVSLGYFYSIAYRLDWVRYIKRPFYWRVASLHCPDKKPEAVVVLSEGPDSSPKYTLRYDSELADYLDTLPPSEPVTVSIRRIGYLWEFNYATKLIALSIDSKGIKDYWRKLPEDLVDCTYGPPQPRISKRH